MPDSASASGDAPPKQKRSFFKKPSWKQNVDNTDDDDPIAMFDRSKETFSAVMKEQERARLKRLQEQEEKARKKELKASKQGKRRKIDLDEECHSEEEGLNSARRDESKRSRSKSPTQDDVPAHSSQSPQPKFDANSLTARYETAARRRETAPKIATVIDLGESDLEDGILPPVRDTVKQTTGPPAVDPDDDIDESDPELREIVRETRRKKRLEREQKAMQGTPPAGTEIRNGSSPGIARAESTPLTPPPQDPPVQILITSRIPGTKPLIVTRKLRQRLQEVRLAWCKRQGFDQEMIDSVFFTYKGRRLYDVATCRSLGLDVDSYGNVYMKGNPDWDENDDKVMVEAVTQEIHQGNIREARRNREPEPEAKLAPELEQKRTRIIIKTKDYGEAKFFCGPDTNFEKLAASSIVKLRIPAEKRPYLLFDGERLQPDGTMADLEDFEDGDALEMHFD
ncbi:Small ubiquitin-related modifier SUMO [Macrophomina phaseolina MS6]|uniref:Small ubiquitin-related modifier SUMO n=1 Tax=Macrophomina phaseolina (strain MS6) TaxID=1126212 RepID=K2RJ68_MACPH|nr:Small ubiquitin-related modifier SUMO [Macrophomina phaseolina MS6]